MDSSYFWDLIQKAREASGKNDDLFITTLRNALSQLPDDYIFRFAHFYRHYARISYKNKLWAAAYIIQGGCSDDGFDYFRGWLISQGKRVYLNALRDPDSLADLNIEEDEAELEDMLGIAHMAYCEKIDLEREKYYTDDDKYYNKEDNARIDEKELELLKNEIHYASDIDIDWTEDSLPSILPRLATKFLNY